MARILIFHPKRNLEKSKPKQGEEFNTLSTQNKHEKYPYQQQKQESQVIAAFMTLGIQVNHWKDNYNESKMKEKVIGCRNNLLILGNKM